MVPAKAESSGVAEKSIKSLVSAIESSFISAVGKIRPPSIEVNPTINIPQEIKKPKEYLITVNRDGHGRIQSMVVRDYESS